MRKFVRIWVVVSLVLGVSNLAMAARIGNPAAGAGKEKVIGEIEYDHSERDLKGAGVVAEEKSNRILARLDYGLSEQFDGFFKLGAADVEDGEFGLALGGGIKVTIIEEEQLKWGVTAQILNFTSEAEDIADAEEEITEYDIATGLSYAIELDEGAVITPYAGVIGSFVDGEASISMLGITVSIDLEEDDSFGCFAGVDLQLSEDVKFNIEGRFINETSVAGAVQILF